MLLFFSRLLVDAYDRDSGIHKIKWELIANNSNMVFRSGEIPGNKTNVSLKKNPQRLISDIQIIILELTTTIFYTIFEFVFSKLKTCFTCSLVSRRNLGQSLAIEFQWGTIIITRIISISTTAGWLSLKKSSQLSLFC